MMTLQQYSRGLESIPTSVTWYLADLGEARGKQQLFTRQSPQRLSVLREHALIESAVSSSRIEGIEVDQSRVRAVVLGNKMLRDRMEEEVRGYREALRLIHERGANLGVSQKTILELHRLVRGQIGDAGKYKETDSDIIERQPSGRHRVRFKSVSAGQTRDFVRQTVDLWNRCLRERWVHPLAAMAAFNLDFLCIHPFRDGNGRVSRLLLLLQCYHLGYEVGRYISIERLIEENKERYYETLEQSSQGWHTGKHDAWPYVNYILWILKNAYREFEERLEDVRAPRGAKTDLVEAAVRSFAGKFSLADLERACPGVSRDMIRIVLRRLKSSGKVECLGRGPGALWQKKGTTPKKR